MVSPLVILCSFMASSTATNTTNDTQLKSAPSLFPLVGLIGGLGPASSAAFTQRMVQAAHNAGATKDHEHVPFILFSNPRLPNARLAVLQQGGSPLLSYVATFKALASAGCTHVGIINNTGHGFARAAAHQSDLPFLDMIDCAAQHAVHLASTQAAPDALRPAAELASTGEHCPIKIGLLATDATVQMGFYHSAVQAAACGAAAKAGGSPFNAEVLSPSQRQLLAIQRCIDAAKAGTAGQEHSDTLLEVASSLQARGCSVVIAGCTELPLMLPWAGPLWTPWPA